jgi:succinate dehydrogenase flavin-adding protein (antitoxin of CptAB toxin-antitoxin module)
MYLSEQLSQMSFNEKMALAKMLESFDWHLAALPDEVKKLEEENNKSNLDLIDMTCQRDKADLLIDNIRNQLNTWRIVSND